MVRPSQGRVLIAAILMFWMATLVAPVFAQESNIEERGVDLSLSDYVALLSQAIDLYDEREENGRPAVPQEQIEPTLATLAAVEQVVLPDGSRVAVAPLLAGIDDTQVIQARLRALLRQIEASNGDDTANRLAILEEVLARPIFQTRTPLWQRLWRWLRDWLRQIQLPEINTGQAVLPPGLGQVVAYVAAAIAFLLLVALLSYWFQGLIHNSITGSDGPRHMYAGDADPVTATEATQIADRSAAAGNFRHAVRQLYLAALLTLDERELIAYSPSATNREVLNQLAIGSAVRMQLQPMTETFDHVWYGVREPDATTYEAYRRDMRRLERTIQHDFTDHPDMHPVATP